VNILAVKVDKCLDFNLFAGKRKIFTDESHRRMPLRYEAHRSRLIGLLGRYILRHFHFPG
jgi:hypothetical protein